MKLYEHQGKELFRSYNIPVLTFQTVTTTDATTNLPFPFIAKAQLRSGDRKKAGGIVVVETKEDLTPTLNTLIGSTINNERVETVLLEPYFETKEQYYLSFSYSTKHKGPVLALNPHGGSGINNAHLYPINVLEELTDTQIMSELTHANFNQEDHRQLTNIILNLWKLFKTESAIVAEINPLIKTNDNTFFAVDAKVDLGTRRPVEVMDGDIAVIASGGGASLINMDALLAAGGKPANYAEYSGNPPRDVVTKITKEVLERPGIKGCWVVGGIANFTDIYETMSGFVEGLKSVTPKPTFPFVIRRDGPRQPEAMAMLKEFAEKEGFEFYLFDSQTPMVDTAQTIVDLAYGNTR